MFDILAPLPTDPLLLEASAGTGKTWTIAALTARFLAETDTTIDQCLLITFSNKAAQELRSRVFERLASTEKALSDFQAWGRRPTDEVADFLCRGGDDAVAERRRRLRAALQDFDSATICTTHVFCQNMLQELGVLGDWDVGETITSDPLELIDECATDVYVARYQDVADPTLDPRRARTIAREACQSALPLESPLEDDKEYCEAVRRRFAERKRTLGIVTFDDLTVRLRDVLTSPSLGDWALGALRERFFVVLVDEFQDTDPLQWRIIEQAFVAPGRATVLIGDPKQSIYGFRSADLMSYLDAARATSRQSLPVNRRSDAAVVAGVQELFGNLPLGDPSITVTDVGAHHTSRLRMGGMAARVLLRRGTADALRHPPHEAIAHDLVRLTATLLARAHVLGDDGVERPLSPLDIAVLVRNRARGREMVTALQDAGIPAVFHGQDSVLAGPAAADWAKLLAAMVSPTRSTIVMAAATDLLGFPLEGLIAGDGDSVAASLLVHRLARAHTSGGIPEVVAELVAETNLDARVLATPGGERTLTDLHHVAELLATSRIADVVTLQDWLARARGRSGTDGTDTRVATDAPAVRVTTMHSAKGLEFGVVLLPEVSDLVSQSRKPFPVVLDGVRHLYVGPPLDYRDTTRLTFERQQREEELRLLYVALTRAKYMSIAWHVAGKRSQSGALTALLARDRDTTELRDRYGRVPPDIALEPALVNVTELSDEPPAPREPTAAPVAPLAVARMTRTIDQVWRRTSYSGLTAGLHELAHSSPADEPVDVDVQQPPPGGALALPSPMAGLPGGAAFGTLVHAALEEVDWRPGHLPDSAARVSSALVPRFGLPADQAHTLATALVSVCTTPLGALMDGASLSEIPLEHRLAELDFDLPMGVHGPGCTVGDLAALMGNHLGADDPLQGYPRHLAESPAADGVLRGFLTGSIDAVLLSPSGRHVVVDYKTNRLPTGLDEDLTVGHYRSAAMARAMIQSHYPLQALLYCVALHRFLAWRLPGYHPEQHLGGAGYLFVRGMAGPTTPDDGDMPCGVFTWHPPAALVLAASDLIGGSA